MPRSLERAGLHLLKAQGKGTLNHPALYRLACQIQRAGARGAVVVDVEHRDAGQPHAVQCRLAGSRVAIDVAGVGLLDRIVGNACIGDRETAGGRAHFRIGRARARLGERDHADARNDHIVCHVHTPH